MNTTFAPRDGNLNKPILESSPRRGGGGGEGEGVGMLKLLIDQHNTVSFRKLCRR